MALLIYPLDRPSLGSIIKQGLSARSIVHSDFRLTGRREDVSQEMLFIIIFRAMIQLDMDTEAGSDLRIK